MTPAQKIEMQPPTTTPGTPEAPLVVETGKLIERLEDLTRTVAKRAYDYFEERGRTLGSELEDWIRAEAEFIRGVSVTLKETEGDLIILAEVPGIKTSDLRINVEPRQVMIESQVETKTEPTAGEVAERVLFNERRSGRFHRVLALPVEVDPSKVGATLRDGILEIRMTKVAARQPVGIEVKSS